MSGHVVSSSAGSISSQV